ncbi:hypothetical protein B4U80_07296 [Leptotrombidium deliense]|uniref:Uncharacterized protein n=1 Tax=Leptotrombidium deliense TaxID=299467 RepID=A0A443SC77_9ACAR|nr:hypothetical protein B4U80_07296 [Leptotrombidium deliense]
MVIICEGHLNIFPFDSPNCFFAFESITKILLITFSCIRKQTNKNERTNKGISQTQNLYRTIFQITVGFAFITFIVR